MSKKNNLSVRPMRKYRKPGYPSWQEPNPLEHAYSKPYPFTQKALHLLAASGICGALFLWPEVGADGAVPKEKMALVEGDTLKNPFPFERMGLPFHTTPFGTGMPDRISAAEAKAVIDSVFRAEGFDLKKTVLKASDGVVEVNGYDAEQKIGYLWIGYDRMDSDMRISWRKVQEDKKEKGKTKEPMISADQDLVRYGHSLNKLYAEFSGRRNPEPPEKRFAQKLKTLLDSSQPDWKEDYRFLYYEYLLDRHVERLEAYGFSTPYMLDYLKGIMAMQPGKKKDGQLTIAVFLLAHHSIAEDWMDKALVEAATMRNYKKYMQQLSILQDAYMQFQNSLPDKQSLIQQYVSQGKKGWKTATNLLPQWLDELKINMAEAWVLNGDADRGERCVALISQQDEGWSYYVTEADLARRRQEAREMVQQQYPQADSTEVEEKLKNYLWGGDGPTKESVLQNLERQVHEYILWARQQRGY